PERGFWWSWVATIASGAITYLLGKIGGQNVLKRYSGATGGRFTRFMGKNGFLASFAIRFVPSAPFIVVNMGMAAAGVPFLQFLGGLALGVLPKTAMVAYAGDGIMDALEGKLGAALLAAVIAIAIWFGVVYVVRRLVRRGEAGEAEDDA
ncbi:MAG: TVP38/TMEM64 family protein, partial [Hyphomonadaceae bacterium]